LAVLDDGSEKNIEEERSARDCPSAADI